MSAILDEGIAEAHGNLKRAQKRLAESLDHPQFSYIEAALKAFATVADKVVTLERLRDERGRKAQP